MLISIVYQNSKRYMGMNHNISGIHNVIADSASTKFKEGSECMISNKVSVKLCNLWGKTEKDLFTTRPSSKLSKYVSRKPDPGSVSIDSFSISWRYCYYWHYWNYFYIGAVSLH